LIVAGLVVLRRSLVAARARPVDAISRERLSVIVCPIVVFAACHQA
jgi:hypothetical protein